MEEVLRAGTIRFLLEKERVRLDVKGNEGAGIKVQDGSIIQGDPIDDSFLITVEDFMNILFGIYGIEEKVVLNMGAKRIEVSKSRDVFLKFTDFSNKRRTIFYLNTGDFRKLLLRAEVIRCQLKEIRFFHKGVYVRYDKVKGVLSFASEEESDELYGISLYIFKEVIRNGITYDLGFHSFGAGKVSVTKPNGRIVLGGKWKDTSHTKSFILAPDRDIPKLTAKIFVATR